MRASTMRWDERASSDHTAMLAHYKKLLALRAGVVVPRIEHGVQGEGYQVLAERTLRVRWRCGDGSRLGVVANLGAEPADVSYAFDGVAFYTLGEVPPRADATALAPWSVGWFITS